jgi:hypothetical protein
MRRGSKKPVATKERKATITRSRLSIILISFLLLYI